MWGQQWNDQTGYSFDFVSSEDSFARWKPANNSTGADETAFQELSRQVITRTNLSMRHFETRTWFPSRTQKSREESD